jgi:quercetin 2,3-dioxygenase
MHITRQGATRGHTTLSWLQGHHTFSFGEYYDPAYVGFGPLRALNEDRVAPGAGFGQHTHQDMEILSWVLSGTLEHKDSLGNGAQLHPGELQRISAGTGIRHSEFNSSNKHPLHLLQIWIVPEKSGLPPEYEQKAFPPPVLANQWCLIASGRSRPGAVRIHQDVDLYALRMSASHQMTHVPMTKERKIWLQVTRGRVETDGDTLSAGDGAAWTAAASVDVLAQHNSEILLFDMIA